MNVLRRVFDVASFAMDTILSVDNEPRARMSRLVRVRHLVDPGWTIKSRGLSVTGKIVADRRVRIMQAKMDRLVLFVVGVGKIDR